MHEYLTHANIHKIIYFYLISAKQVKDLLLIAGVKKFKRYLSLIQEINPNDPILYKKVEELDLSIRPLNCLKNAHIVYVGELIQKTYEDLRRIRNMGRLSVDQIKDVLADMGLCLGTKLHKWSKEDAEKLLAKIANPYN